MLKWLPVIFLFTSCGGGRYFLQDSFSHSPVPPAPDYSNEKNWAALPFTKNITDSFPGNIDPVKDSAVDVFFIHPTIFTYKPRNQYQWNADVNDSYLNRKVDESTMLHQATAFNECRIFAPRYRQAQISSFFPKYKEDGSEALDIAYSDVKNAFEYYLEHYNNGRPFIIASHSQGTYHALRLINDLFGDTVLQKKLVAAYLVGMPVNPDSLKWMKPCDSSSATGCYCTWNTFARNYYPSYYDSGLNHAVCTNPLSWKTNEIYCADSLNRGAVLWNFSKIIPHACDAQVHQGMMWINKPRVAFAKVYPIKIYHEGDINLFYLNIRKNVNDRIEAYEHLQHNDIKNLGGN